MTKEIKLSLIFGFALVLVVGVLLSDHLSGARRATLDGVEPAQGVVVAVDQSAPVASHSPDLILVDELGRPQPRQAPKNAVAIDPPASSSGTMVLASPEPVPVPERAPLLERLRQSAREGLALAVDDLGSGRTPDAAVSLSGEQPASVEPRASADVTRPVTDPSYRLYTVKEGDTLWSIASRTLGDGRRHKELLDLNKDRLGAGGDLRAGAAIKIPTSEAASDALRPVLTSPKPAPAPSAEPAFDRQAKKDAAREPSKKDDAKSRAKYQVKAGDTLSKIAAKTLGSAGRYDDILLANAGTLKDEDSLEVGMVLDIPTR